MTAGVPWYLLIFLQSNLLELPFYAWGLRRHGRGKVALAATLANSITHPIVFFLILSLGLARIEAILLSEAWAVAGETAILWLALERRVSWARIAGVSLAANLVSWELAPRITFWLLM